MMNKNFITLNFKDIFNLNDTRHTSDEYNTIDEYLENIKTQQKTYNLISMSNDVDKQYKVVNNVVGKVDYVKAMSGCVKYSKTVKRINSNKVTNYIFSQTYCSDVSINEIIEDYYDAIHDLANDFSKTVTICLISQYYSVFIDITPCNENQLKQLLFSDGTIRIIMTTIIDNYISMPDLSTIQNDGYGSPVPHVVMLNQIDRYIKHKGLSNTKIYIGGELCK